jgi:hypothetical protein
MRGSIVRIYLQPTFVVCVLVLSLSGAVMSQFYIEQEPWPLVKSLNLLDQSGMGPYRIIRKTEITDKDTLKALGTEDYIQWILEDTEVPEDSSCRRTMLFVTYYPLADRVPHAPEICFIGAGYDLLASKSVQYTLEIAGAEKTIPGTRLVFQGGSSGYWEKLSQFYLMNVNGIYAGDRDAARFTLNKNIFRKHSYFSKIEWNFMAGSGSTSYLDEDEGRKAGEKLLAVVLPILEREHWPKEGSEQNDN